MFGQIMTKLYESEILFVCFQTICLCPSDGYVQGWAVLFFPKKIICICTIHTVQVCTKSPPCKIDMFSMTSDWLVRVSIFTFGAKQRHLSEMETRVTVDCSSIFILVFSHYLSLNQIFTIYKYTVSSTFFFLRLVIFGLLC